MSKFAASCRERDIASMVLLGLWAIDDEGLIWVVAKHRTGRSPFAPRPVRPHRADRLKPDGYLHVSATVGGTRLYTPAHRLVWQVARGDIAQGFVVNHIDGNKTNNRLSNLEVVSPLGNLEHAFRAGLRRLTFNGEQICRIRARRESGERLASIAADYGTSPQHIHRIANGAAYRPELLA